MTLAAPLMLLGLLAIAGPIYVHLTRRQDHQERPFPSLMFLRKLPFKEKQQLILRDKLLLALRCLAIAMACLAFASPFFSHGDSEQNAAYEHDIVLLFDTSYSMGIANREAQAREETVSRIERMASNERMALIAFDESTRVVVELTDSKSELLEGLKSIAIQPVATNMSIAFDASARLLSRSSTTRQSVVLVSDVQASGVNAGVPLRMPKDAELEVVRIESDVPANATIVGATITPGADTGEHVIGMRVKNTGDSTADNVRVYARIDDRLRELGTLSLESGEEKQMQTPIVLASDRPTEIEIGVSGDEFAIDNRTYLTGIKGRVVNVGILQTTAAAATQSRFLNAALVRANEDTVIETVTVEDIKDQSLRENLEVLVVIDANLDESAKNALDSFVDLGGGVLYIAGEQSNLGFETKSLVDTQTTLRIASAAEEHPLSYRTELGTSGTLSNVAVMAWRDISTDDNTNSLLRFGSDRTLLAEQTTDGGRVLLLATSLDPAWSTLALEPGFVTFARRIVDYLANRTTPATSVNTGTSVDMTAFAGSLPAGGAWLTMLKNTTALIEAPNGNQTTVGSGKNVYVPRQPGVHQIHASTADVASLPLAVNVARVESDFTSASSSELRKRLIHDSARNDTITLKQGTNANNARPVAWYLLAVAGLLFLLESIIGNRLTGSRRQTQVT